MPSRVSVRLVLSYVLDWIIIIAIAAIGAGISGITPNKRPFNLADSSLSFPYVDKEKISTATLVVVSVIAPAIIIFVTALFVGLGPNAEKSSRASSLRRKLWEWNAGWMGLGLALALAFFITDGIKNLVGKPRPDLLARCDPDASRLLTSTVGGIEGQIDEGVNLVSWTICRNLGETLDEGFRSFPSGHSSLSFAGLTYLALFICAKGAITIPFLSYHPLTGGSVSRNRAAAAPTYLLVFPLIPICAAIYISSTRYSDFYHHGFDIIAGAILGIATAWLGFRWYHLPISRGGGWAWAPRSPQRAFVRGLGVLTYAEEEKEQEMTSGLGDVESEPVSHGGESSRGVELNSLAPIINKNPGIENESSRL